MHSFSLSFWCRCVLQIWVCLLVCAILFLLTFSVFLSSDAERQDEAQWIFHQLDLGFGVDEQMAKSAIEHVLRFLGVESQEVPFVWHYRR